MRERYHIGVPTLIGGFNCLRRFLDFQRISLQIPIALYHTRRYGVIGEEQHQINKSTKPFIIRRKYATFKRTFPTETTFDGCMPK